MATTKKKGTRRRAAAEVAVRSVVKMPLGELTRFAARLAEVDPDVARFLLCRLREALMLDDSSPEEGADLFA